MILSKPILSDIESANLDLPILATFELPEKVLQFGTGVLLRGLPDYFIDKANKAGKFNGRIVMVKSTSKGSIASFEEQDCLYTISIRGVKGGKEVAKNVVSSAISRVLDANRDWQSVLKVGASKDLKLIVSNTTEVGLVLINEHIQDTIPKSYPAKLLAVLHERYRVLGDATGKLVVIATELVPDNGKVLRDIIVELISYNMLDDSFYLWLKENVVFCNSLVDRIVPGKPEASILETIEKEIGYQDDLLIMAEPYGLWAIEGDQSVADFLCLDSIDEGLIVRPDIEIYRELKVRLLNGSHTLASGIAYLSGIETVAEAIQNDTLLRYINDVIHKEIIPAIPYSVVPSKAEEFAKSVLDRFANPFIKHPWVNITFQYTMKLKVRVVPVISQHYTLFAAVPERIAFGFAAYLVFITTAEADALNFKITDDKAEYINAIDKTDFVYTILSDESLWGLDLTSFEGFKLAVEKYFHYITSNGVTAGLALIR
jgi:tagaturonate reductase